MVMSPLACKLPLPHPPDDDNVDEHISMQVAVTTRTHPMTMTSTSTCQSSDSRAWSPSCTYVVVFSNLPLVILSLGTGYMHGNGAYIVCDTTRCSLMNAVTPPRQRWAPATCCPQFQCRCMMMGPSSHMRMIPTQHLPLNQSYHLIMPMRWRPLLRPMWRPRCFKGLVSFLFSFASCTSITHWQLDSVPKQTVVLYFINAVCFTSFLLLTWIGLIRLFNYMFLC